MSTSCGLGLVGRGHQGRAREYIMYKQEFLLFSSGMAAVSGGTGHHQHQGPYHAATSSPRYKKVSAKEETWAEKGRCC